MDNLLDLLRSELGEAPLADTIMRTMPRVVSSYLDSHPALLAEELEEALGTMLQQYQRRIDGTAPGMRFCSPVSNAHLREAVDIKYLSLPDAIALVQGIDQTQYQLSVHSGDERYRRPQKTYIYYKMEDGLREYLTPRIEENSRTVNVTFRREPRGTSAR